MRSLSTAIETARRRLYSGPIRRLFENTGLDELVASLYWRTLYRLSDNPREVRVGDVSATFGVENTFEFFAHVQNEQSEGPVLEDLLANLRPDDVFYDVGANVGIYACLAADALTNGEVVAFEPHPANARRIRENFQLNGASGQIVESALSNEAGTVEFAIGSEQAGKVNPHIATDDEDETISVETARGDDLVATGEIPPPTVVKVDVEGAELGVLWGLEESLRENCRAVYCEVHQDAIRKYGGRPGEVADLLSSAGFEVSELHRRRRSDGEDDLFIKGRRS